MSKIILKEQVSYMSEKEKININSLQINLSDEKSIEHISNQLSELKKEGYEQVTVDFKVSSVQELNKFGIDSNIFKKIKETQELPDWVVINFILAGGKLNGKRFKVKSFNE
jgi:hypothetical protein